MSAINLKPPPPKNLVVPSLKPPIPITAQKPVEEAPPWDETPAIDWNKGDNLDVPALKPKTPSITPVLTPGAMKLVKEVLPTPNVPLSFTGLKDGDKTTVDGKSVEIVLLTDEEEELAAALLLYDRMESRKKRLIPKILVEGSMRECKAALAYTKKAGPHPTLRDAEVHLRQAIDLYEAYIKELGV